MKALTFLTLVVVGLCSVLQETSFENIYTRKLSIAQKTRSRRSYADIEESVSSFLDDVDFYLEKVGIIRYIILDCR